MYNQATLELLGEEIERAQRKFEQMQFSDLRICADLASSSFSNFGQFESEICLKVYSVRQKLEDVKHEMFSKTPRLLMSTFGWAAFEICAENYGYYKQKNFSSVDELLALKGGKS